MQSIHLALVFSITARSTFEVDISGPSKKLLNIDLSLATN
jgi:hypothetical protein